MWERENGIEEREAWEKQQQGEREKWRWPLRERSEREEKMAVKKREREIS